MLPFIDLEERVPAEHSLRAIKRLAAAALADLSPTFDAMYRAGGRPSIPRNGCSMGRCSSRCTRCGVSPRSAKNWTTICWSAEQALPTAA
jgi:hypothetical protein